jgi:hypothetical protein
VELPRVRFGRRQMNSWNCSRDAGMMFLLLLLLLLLWDDGLLSVCCCIDVSCIREAAVAVYILQLLVADVIVFTCIMLPSCCEQ